MIPLLLAAVVSIDNFAYAPASLTVRAGTTVRFVNRDSEAHTVTFPALHAGSPGLDTGDSWQYRFLKPGRYAYICALHPYMKGTIVVVRASAVRR